MSTKKYQLLKDLPDAKVGTVLIEDNNDNCYNYTSIYNEGCWYNKPYVENNPEWFEEIKERIEVVDIKVAAAGELFTYSLILNEPIPEDKLPLIKEAISRELNGVDLAQELKLHNEKMGNQILDRYKSEDDIPKEKTFTQEQLNEERRKAFEASRVFSIILTKDNIEPFYSHPTFEDYLKSIQ